MAQERSKRKEEIGFVTSNKMDKTVTIEVERKSQHPLYKRVVVNTKKFKAHDENNECRPGDKVRIIETRPLSKNKRWRVVEILREAD